MPLSENMSRLTVEILSGWTSFSFSAGGSYTIAESPSRATPFPAAARPWVLSPGIQEGKTLSLLHYEHHAYA